MKEMTTEMRGPIPSWMIIDAVRYATGRMSYQVGVTVDWVVANWARLPDHARLIIQKDLETEFDRDDRSRLTKDKWLPLGHDCDRQQWECVRAMWRTNENNT